MQCACGASPKTLEVGDGSGYLSYPDAQEELGAGPQPDVLAENNLVFPTWGDAGLSDGANFEPSATSPARDSAAGQVDYITSDHLGRPRYVGPAGDVGAVEGQGVSGSGGDIPAPEKPLLKEFMGINGHFTFKPELYRQVGRLVRNYHNVNWDVRQPGDPVTVPVCVNGVNWKTDVYGPWAMAGYETDICIQFSGFKADTANYEKFWRGQEAWCYGYGRSMATSFGPSGRDRLCTSIEIGNEPGGKFDPAIYQMVFEQVAKGIRDGDPRVKILTPAVHARAANDYVQDLRGIYAQPEILPLYDVINLHTYAEIERADASASPWNRSYPEDPSIGYLEVVDEAIAWRDQNAPGKQVWITEFGYDACTPGAMGHREEWSLKLDWQGFNDLQQAQYLVRSVFAFAERDVQRAYIYYYDDADSASVHGSSGLTRNFEPKASFWAVKQLYDLLGEYRFKRVVTNRPGELLVHAFEHGGDPRRVIWVAWSPTGTRTHEKEGHVPREFDATLTGLPARPSRAVGMATAEGIPPAIEFEAMAPSSIRLRIGESPVYIVMGE